MLTFVKSCSFFRIISSIILTLFNNIVEEVSMPLFILSINPEYPVFFNLSLISIESLRILTNPFIELRAFRKFHFIFPNSLIPSLSIYF